MLGYEGEAFGCSGPCSTRRAVRVVAVAMADSGAGRLVATETRGRGKGEEEVQLTEAHTVASRGGVRRPEARGWCRGRSRGSPAGVAASSSRGRALVLPALPVSPRTKEEEGAASGARRRKGATESARRRACLCGHVDGVACAERAAAGAEGRTT